MYPDLTKITVLLALRVGLLSLEWSSDQSLPRQISHITPLCDVPRPPDGEIITMISAFCKQRYNVKGTVVLFFFSQGVRFKYTMVSEPKIYLRREVDRKIRKWKEIENLQCSTICGFKEKIEHVYRRTKMALFNGSSVLFGKVIKI